MWTSCANTRQRPHQSAPAAALAAPGRSSQIPGAEVVKTGAAASVSTTAWHNALATRGLLAGCWRTKNSRTRGGTSAASAVVWPFICTSALYAALLLCRTDRTADGACCVAGSLAQATQELGCDRAADWMNTQKDVESQCACWC